jgi:hypothetical protein
MTSSLLHNAKDVSQMKALVRENFLLTLAQ